MNSYLKSKLSQTGFSKKEPNKKPKKKGQLEPLATESKAITEIEKLHLHPAANFDHVDGHVPAKVLAEVPANPVEAPIQNNEAGELMGGVDQQQNLPNAIADIDQWVAGLVDEVDQHVLQQAGAALEESGEFTVGLSQEHFEKGLLEHQANQQISPIVRKAFLLVEEQKNENNSRETEVLPSSVSGRAPWQTMGEPTLSQLPGLEDSSAAPSSNGGSRKIDLSVLPSRRGDEVNAEDFPSPVDSNATGPMTRILETVIKFKKPR